MRLSNLGTKLLDNPNFKPGWTFDLKEKLPETFDFSNDEDFMKPVTFTEEDSKLESPPSSDDESNGFHFIQVSPDSGADISPETEAASRLLQSLKDQHSTNLQKEEHSAWLQENVVEPYWHPNYTIAACFAKFSGKPYQISEGNFMTECIWLLHGMKDVFSFPWNGKAFTLREGIELFDISQGALESISKTVCEHSAFVVEIQGFCARCRDETTPKISQAFALALKMELRPFQKELVEKEKIIIDQDETMTLLTLVADLDPWLNHVRLLWHLLQVCIIQHPLGSKTPSNQAVQLLFTLYSQLLESDNTFGRHPRQFPTLLTLFLETCGPFLDFVDQLLNSGDINDPHNEFVIQKGTAGKAGAENVLVLRDIPAEYTEDFFLLKFLNKVILAASLVVTLKENDSWKDSGNLEKTGSLSSTFIGQCFRKNGTREPRKQRNDYFKTLPTEPADASVMTEDLIRNLDPLLKGYFKHVLPVNSNPKLEDDPDICWNPEVSNGQVYEERPLQLLLEDILFQLISERCDHINRRAMDVLKGDLYIKDHLKTIGNCFLFGDGESMKQFVSKVFKKILKKQNWKSTEYLSLLFKMSVNETETPKHIERVHPVLKEQNVATASANHLEELGHLSLNYSAPSPINLILNSGNMVTYQSLFCFLMKLNCAKYSLDRIRFKDMKGWSDWKPTASENFLYRLRIDLLHFVNQLHHYFMTGVIYNKQGQFLSSLDTTESFHEALSLHQHHLESLQQFCLLAPSRLFLHTQLCHLLNLVMTFTRNWSPGTLNSRIQALVGLEKEFHYHIWALSKCLSMFWRNSSSLDPAKQMQYTDLGVLSNLIAAQTRKPSPSLPLDS